MWPIFCYPFTIRSIQLILRYYNINDIYTSSWLLNGFMGLTMLPASTQCHSLFAVLFFALMTILLTFLQFYWGITVINNLCAILINIFSSHSSKNIVAESHSSKNIVAEKKKVV
jgi:hypothetical protein